MRLRSVLRRFRFDDLFARQGVGDAFVAASSDVVAIAMCERPSREWPHGWGSAPVVRQSTVPLSNPAGGNTWWRSLAMLP
jgi:hypothetical protein